MRCGLIVALLLVAAVGAQADLFSYLAKPDDSFKWELRGVSDKPNGKVYDLHLVSQVWQGIKWEHALQIHEPRKIEYPDAMALYITGGGPDDGSQFLGLSLANFSGMRYATLYHIPNQPLFNGLTEDALISHTWVKYLETGEEDWVINFAMAKAVTRAMDCLDQVAAQQWQTKPRGYFVLGASKRGWTTYLSAAAAPERILAIAPMVFDILNLPLQIQHQRDFWGDYSEEISDYTSKGLTQIGDSPRGFHLSFMVDPYSYRDRLTMPKLVVLGSNDAYWPTDAVNLYYPGLPAPKLLLIVPNATHGLEDRMRVIASVGGFFRLVARGAPLPQPQWEWSETRAGLALRVKNAAVKPTAARLWVAHSDIQDFRKSKYEEAPLPAEGDDLVGQVARAEGKFTGTYAELVFDVDGRKFYVSTQPRVMSPVPK